MDAFGGGGDFQDAPNPHNHKPLGATPSGLISFYLTWFRSGKLAAVMIFLKNWRLKCVIYESMFTILIAAWWTMVWPLRDKLFEV